MLSVFMALKPNQPNHNMEAPIKVNTKLCGAIGSLPYPTRLPITKAKNLNGVLNLYEMVHDKREPLMISSTREWTLSGGASNVLAEVKGNSVIITTAPKKSK